MTAKDSILLRCISIHGVPEDIEEDDLRKAINSQYNINIVRIEEVPGAEANSKLKRWILELDGELYVRKLKNKSLELNTDEHSVLVEFKEPTECELPSSFTMPQVPTRLKPTGRHQSQSPFAVSGYYHNVPNAPFGWGQEGRQAHEQMDQGHQQFSQGLGSMGLGFEQMSQWHGPMAQGHEQLGQGSTGQGHGLKGHYGPIQGQYSSMYPQQQQPQQPSFVRDPSNGQFFVNIGYNWMPVTEEYIKQMQSHFQQPTPPAQQHLEHGQTQDKVTAIDTDDDSEFKQAPEQKAEDDQPSVSTSEEKESPYEQPTKIKLTHLPSDIDEEDVQMFLESRKMGSLSVVKVVVHGDTNSAIVQMESAEDAQSLIKMGTFQMTGIAVFVEQFDAAKLTPETELTERTPPSILVTGLPAGIDEDDISMLFENKRRFDVEVVDIQFNEETLSAVIFFGSQTDVEHVMEKCPLKLMGTFVQCERHGGDTFVQPQCSKPTEPKLLITGLPENIDEDDVKMFFENKRKFNDVVFVDVNLNEEYLSAVITCRSDDDVEHVLEKCPLKMMGRQLHVQRYGISDAYEKPSNNGLTMYTEPVFDGSQTEILVEDIPAGVDEEMLEMCFTSRKLKSCTVEKVDFAVVDNNAVVKFSRPQDVKTVLDNLPIKMKKKDVSVQIYVPKKLCTIIVQGSKEIMKEEHEETFEMYFENEKKSGGGNISELELRPTENAFYITFKDEYVAKRVVDRGGHRIMRKEVKVELLIPSRSTKVSCSSKNNSGTNDRNVSEYKKDEEQDSQSVKTVKVRGVRRVTSRDSVQRYFENKKKAGGGEIEKRFTDDEDDDIIYIQYKDETVAKAVAERQHTLDGHELAVSLYTPPVPPPSYPNKLLIKGLNPKITCSILELYLEAKAGLTLVPSSMTYHVDNQDTALVTVDGDVDMPKLEEACKSKPLEGSLLRFSLVPISNCVLVSNISDAVTEDMVSLYFENAKRSNGGTVDKVEMFLTQNYCLVYFVDYKVVDNVLSKEQMLDGKQLEVRRYFPCIGRAEGDTVERRFKKPAPFTVKANVQKIKFLHRSSANKEAAEKQLAMCDATINWPVAKDVEYVDICCTLSAGVKDCVKLAKDWITRSKTSFEDFMNTLEVENVVVVQDILNKVTEELGKLSIDNPEAVAILIQRQENKIYIVGIKGTVSGLKTQVGRIVKDVQDASEKVKTWTKTTLNHLKPIETKMLLADKFPSQMGEKFSDVKVNINKHKNEIEIEGVYSLVNAIQIEMYKIKDTFVRNESIIPNEATEMYMSRPVKDHIVKKLKHNKVVAVWETVNGKLFVMSKHETMLSQAVEIVSKSVSIGKVQLIPMSRPLVQTDKWANVEQRLLADHQYKLSINITLDAILVVCTEDIYNSVLESIDEFLDKNIVYVDKLSFAMYIHQLLKNNHYQSVADIAKSKNVHVQMDESEFEISGTKNDIKIVRQELESLATRVKKKEHLVSKPGISDFMHTNKGRGIMKTVESTLPVIVRSSDEDSGDDEYGIYSPGANALSLPPGCSIVASCMGYGTRNIHVMCGDMTDLNVDAIVNAAYEKLSLCGGLGKAILRKGGDAIGRDWKQYIDAHRKLGEAAVFVSTAGNLKAKSIIHIAGPVWKDGRQEEDDKLTEVVFKAMHQASGKGYKSLAMPAISCGAYGYPVKRATGVIVASVKNFFREVQESELTEIYLCDTKEDTVSGFIEGLEKEWGASSVRRFNRKQWSSAITLPPGSITPMDSSYEENIGTYSSLSRKGTDYSRPQPPSRTLPVKLGNITVEVKKAEIAKHNIPVIVNTTSRNLDLNNGAVSKTILKQAGLEIQNELKQSCPNGIAEGEVAVTKGYKLKCTNVIHGAVSNWDGQQKTLNELKNFVKLCMEETQKRNHSGIAFPAIGTGNLGYPRDVVATEMLTAVSEFAAKYPQSSINNVDFILYPNDEGTIKAFEYEITNWAKGGRKGRARDYDSYDNLRSRTTEGLDKIKDPKYWLEDEDIDNARDYDPYDNLRSRTTEDGDEEHLYEELPCMTSGKESNDFTIGNVRITVRQGDLTREDVDCIINSSNETLDLKIGKVSQALVKMCGEKLEKEAKSKHQEMKKEGLAITNAHKLKCKKIMHVVAKETASEWKHVVGLCLRKAKTERYRSIAFPALGTGMSINAADTAKVMFQAVKEFAHEGCGSLTDVRFVIFQSEMVDDFKRAAQLAQGVTAGHHKKPHVNAGRDRLEKVSGSKHSVCLIIYAMEESDIRKAITQLDGLIDGEVSTTPFTDSIIKRLDDRQRDVIKRIAENHNVDFKPTNKGIDIVGKMANVHTASTLINQVIKDAIQIEKDKQAAMILKDVVQWYYIEFTDEGDELKPYAINLNYHIEKAFKNQESTYLYREDNTDVVVDFNILQEYEKGETDDNNKSKIVRKDLIKYKLDEVPNDWKEMKGNLLVHALLPTDPNYTKISTAFSASSGSGFTIQKIEMVQNKSLWQQYAATKKQLEGQNPQVTVNERFLWHGTSADTVDSVNAHGFNRSYCGKNATVYGDGVYFAVAANYTCQNTYAVPDANGVKRIYYCGVLTGEYINGQRGMRVPPSKPSGGKNALYDSVTDNPLNPGMFIIFNDTQAYPLFIIHVKRF